MGRAPLRRPAHRRTPFPGRPRPHWDAFLRAAGIGAGDALNVMQPAGAVHLMPDATPESLKAFAADRAAIVATFPSCSRIKVIPASGPAGAMVSV